MEILRKNSNFRPSDSAPRSTRLKSSYVLRTRTKLNSLRLSTFRRPNIANNFRTLLAVLSKLKLRKREPLHLYNLPYSRLSPIPSLNQLLRVPQILLREQLRLLLPHLLSLLDNPKSFLTLTSSMANNPIYVALRRKSTRR